MYQWTFLQSTAFRRKHTRGGTLQRLKNKHFLCLSIPAAETLPRCKKQRSYIFFLSVFLWGQEERRRGEDLKQKNKINKKNAIVEPHVLPRGAKTR